MKTNFFTNISIIFLLFFIFQNNIGFSKERKEDYTDERIKTLAKNLINYSVNLKKGEKLLIYVADGALPLAKALIDETYKAEGTPFLYIKNYQLLRAILMNSGEEQLKKMAELDIQLMRSVDACILLEACENMNELDDVPPDKMSLYQEFYEGPVIYGVCVNEKKWSYLRYPNPAMAQAASMSTEAFEDLFFKVCNLDYSKMDKAMDPLVELMKKTDNVHIKGPGTDITFSIKGIPVKKCAGNINIPDGEIITAPVKNSVNGYITYNIPSAYYGTIYENVRLEFKDGKIIKATGNYENKINELFDTDEGARYIGEFALGVNPYLTKPIKDILFDEKITGSFHLTPGSSYDFASNGNKSAIHWDLVSIQNPEYGGGEIWFDGVLIRKDGKFILPELEVLNPENLTK